MTSNDSTKQDPSPIKIDDLISATPEGVITIVITPSGGLYFDLPNSVYNKVAIFGTLEPIAKIADFFEMLPNRDNKTGRLAIELKPGINIKTLADRIAQHLMTEFGVITEVDDRRSLVNPAPLGKVVQLKLNAGEIAEILLINPGAKVQLCIDPSKPGDVASISIDGDGNFYLYNFNCEE